MTGQKGPRDMENSQEREVSEKKKEFEGEREETGKEDGGCLRIRACAGTTRSSAMAAFAMSPQRNAMPAPMRTSWRPVIRSTGKRVRGNRRAGIDIRGTGRPSPPWRSIRKGIVSWPLPPRPAKVCQWQLELRTQATTGLISTEHRNG